MVGLVRCFSVVRHWLTPIFTIMSGSYEEAPNSTRRDSLFYSRFLQKGWFIKSNTQSWQPRSKTPVSIAILRFFTIKFVLSKKYRFSSEKNQNVAELYPQWILYIKTKCCRVLSKKVQYITFIIQTKRVVLIQESWNQGLQSLLLGQVIQGFSAWLSVVILLILYLIDLNRNRKTDFVQKSVEPSWTSRKKTYVLRLRMFGDKLFYFSSQYPVYYMQALVIAWTDAAFNC